MKNTMDTQSPFARFPLVRHRCISLYCRSILCLVSLSMSSHCRRQGLHIAFEMQLNQKYSLNGKLKSKFSKSQATALNIIYLIFSYLTYLHTAYLRKNDFFLYSRLHLGNEVCILDAEHVDIPTCISLPTDTFWYITRVLRVLRIKMRQSGCYMGMDLTCLATRSTCIHKLKPKQNWFICS